LRILHAVHNYPPEFRGGVERVVEALAAAQASRGHQVVVLAGSEGSGDAPALRRESHAGVPVLRAVRGPGFRDPIDPFRAELGAVLEEALGEAAPDVLHVHHWFNLSNDLVRRAARRRIPSVVTLHDFYTTCGLFFRVPDGATPCDLEQSASACVPCIGDRAMFDAEETAFRVTMRKAAFDLELSCASAVTAPSRSHARAVGARLAPGLPIRVIPPGSPRTAAVDPTPRTGPLRVLHFGNLCRVKGVELLARAVAAADPAKTAVRLTLAGPFVEEGLDTGGAAWAGPFDAGALRALAADADVAAFPSFARESYSLVVDEALRLGLPVLVSDRGALGDRIGGRGIVLPAGDEAAWAAAIGGLARDPSAAVRLRAEMPGALVTPEESADAMLALYADAKVPAGAPDGIEAALLERLAHVERRVGDLVRLLASGRRGE
jgi:glycosyltransferase involved in cell wall biosynthesis